ncbi:Spindle assembly protein [Phytophthora cinnamomi]|uniref:Spindle assembly protein n=1 Tax=Phytophthora cinnamomi TaxID=4785 RepID=UPI00355ACB86|nr:Spindle assembly protein [Phytophthora cinnamomi]
MAMSSSSLGSSRYVDVGADGDAHVPVSSTDELDPSLAGGFRVIYDRETPFELRIQDADNTPQQIGTQGDQG